MGVLGEHCHPSCVPAQQVNGKGAFTTETNSVLEEKPPLMLSANLVSEVGTFPQVGGSRGGCWAGGPLEGRQSEPLSWHAQ